MTADEARQLVEQYLDAAGQRGHGQRYLMRLDELAWLAEQASHLMQTRLKLLQALQAALPRSGRPENESLKGALTDSIIMQTRLASRDEALLSMLRQMAEDKVLESIPVNEEDVRIGIEGLCRAAEHVKAVAER